MAGLAQMSSISADHHPPTPRRNPEDSDFGAIKADLEFGIEPTERFRKELNAQAALHDDRERRDRHSLD
jgi:hypothetical protein